VWLTATWDGLRSAANPLEHESWVLLGCYAVCRDNSSLTVREKPLGPTFRGKS
jgi:hypothetical protein